VRRSNGRKAGHADGSSESYKFTAGQLVHRASVGSIA
jgi:hypothetical protein